MQDVIGQQFTRTFQVERRDINEKSRTVKLAFSSETPYERWWGTEILDHAPESVRVDRLRDGGALLLEHDRFKHIGVVESVTIGADKRGRAVVRFGTGPLAEEVFADIKSGIRRLVSVGYRVHEVVLESQSDKGDKYRVTDWEPYEISIVSVPADHSVGVGRSVTNHRGNHMDTTNENSERLSRSQKRQQRIEGGQPSGGAERNEEIRNILALADFHRAQDLAREAIDNGWSLDDFKVRLLDMWSKQPPIRVAERAPDASSLGLSGREAARFSFRRAILYAMDPTNRTLAQDAGFEIECSEAWAKQSRSNQNASISIPPDVLRAPFLGAPQKRDLLVGTATAGGHTVATDLLAASFIDVLANEMVIMQLGTTLLRDLVGNVAVPRMTAGSTGYWVAENSAATESQQAFDQVTLSPKTVGAYTDFSRQLLLQSSLDIEGVIRMDLARTIALAMDLAAINGSGSSNQPRGILNTVGIGSVAGGTNGAAPTWDHLVQLESAVANANGGAKARRYLTNTKVRGKLKATEMFAGSNGQTVWQAIESQTAPVSISNQVPSNLTKGTASGICSAIIFGDFRDLLVGLWGGLDLLLDTSTGATAGTRRLVAFQSCDIAVRHPESFSAMLDALTT